MDEPRDPEPTSAEFTRLAEEESHGILKESLDWIGSNRKWWLLPIIAALLIAGIFVLAAGSSIAPFIYALF